MSQYMEAFYSKLENLAEIPEDQLLKLRQILKHKKIKKNDYFIQIDDQPNKFAYINEGVFRVYCISEDGNEKILAFRKKGHFVAPYTPLLNKQKVWYSIQALRDCDIYYISTSDYEKLSRNHVCWQLLEKKYILELFIEKEERERTLLMDNAEVRYKNFIANYPEIHKSVQQQYVASYLGITPVSLSRLKSQINP